MRDGCWEEVEWFVIGWMGSGGTEVWIFWKGRLWHRESRLCVQKSAMSNGPCQVSVAGRVGGIKIIGGRLPSGRGKISEEEWKVGGGGVPMFSGGDGRRGSGADVEGRIS